MRENKLYSSFKIDNKTIEVVRHEDDLHYWIYINGSITDVMFPRSTGNDGTSVGDLDIKSFYKLKGYLSYGASKYNQNFFEHFFRNFKTDFPEFFI